MDNQFYSLLVAIIAVTANLLAINKNLSDFSFLKLIRLVTFIALPILYIKPILVFIFRFWILSFVLLLIANIIIVIVSYKRGTGKYVEGDYLTLFLLPICSIIPILGNYYSFLTSSTVKLFIEELQEKTLLSDILLFLSQNLNCSLCLISLATLLVLFLIVTLGFFFIFKPLNIFDFKFPINQNFIYITLSYAFLSCLFKPFVDYFCSLF